MLKGYNGKIPVLMYHALSSVGGQNRYVVATDIFKSHLHYVKLNEIKTVVVDDCLRLFLNDSMSSITRVMLTFDDGHKTDFTLALPLLEAYGAKATFFITTDWIDKNGYMTSAQLKNLSRAGMSVQSHAKSHVFLNTLEPELLYQELFQSKNRLEEILGEEVSFLSCPGGRYNNQVIQLAKEVGYKGMFTSVPFQLKIDDDFFLVGRYGVKTPFPLSSFRSAICMHFPWVMRVIMGYKVKKLLKKILNDRLYYFLWKYYIGNSEKR